MADLSSKEYQPRLTSGAEGGGSSGTESGITAGAVARGLMSLLGIAIILIGLVLALKVFSGVYAVVKSPETFDATFEKWVKVIETDNPDLDLEKEGKVYPVAPVLATIILVAGAFLLVRIPLAFISAGGQLISWSTGDREAVKKIIRETLGPAAYPRRPGT